MRISDWSSDVCSSDLVGGQQPDSLAAHAAIGQRVAGDVLGAQGRQELAYAGVAALLLGLGRGLEEGADRIEVAVGATCGPASRLHLEAEPAGPPTGKASCRERVWHAG